MQETFWAIYALAYDTLTKLKPYDRMLLDCVELLDVRPHQRILDVGCGTGNLIGYLLIKNARVIGIDFSRAMLRRAQKKVGQTEKVELKQVDLMHPLPYAVRSFDSAAIINVLHALPDPHPALKEIARVVKQNGRVVIATPLPTAKPKRVFREHLRHVTGANDWFSLLLIIPALLWVWLCNLFMLGRSRFFTPDELSKLLSENGFRVRRITRTYAEQNSLVVAEVA